MIRILNGDALAVLRTLPDESVHCCVTSPPYWGLRDYQVYGQIGLEQTVEKYTETLVGVFRDVRRVLRPDGTLWLNIGDSYAAEAGGGQGKNSKFLDRTAARLGVREQKMSKISGHLKPKDLVGVPWRIALALQSDGWWLRADIIWSKPNPMPESVTDRPTKSHEYIFLLAKSERYHFDAASIREDASPVSAERYNYAFGGKKAESLLEADAAGIGVRTRPIGLREFGGYRNSRTVWTMPTQPFQGAHFATFPPALVDRCIKAGCPTGGTVLDPFGGAGTTGLVADRLGRNAILIELNPGYCAMAERRIRDDAPLFADVSR